MKIPFTPTDDNTGQAVPKCRNLWEHIKETLPKRTEANDDSHPLTDYLAEADGPLKQLAGSWEQTFEAWDESGRKVPPVLIAICHDTTVGRLPERHIAELGEASPMLVNRPGQAPVTVRIDSDALAKAETGEGDGAAEEIRQLVATCRQGRRTRRPGPVPRVGRPALGGLGRPQRHPHLGTASVLVPAAVRVGRRTRPAPLRLLRPDQARTRRPLRGPVPAAADGPGHRSEALRST